MNDNGAKIIQFPALTVGGKPASAILVPDGLRDAVILGFRADGSFYFSTECEDAGRVMLELRLAERRLLEEVDPLPDLDDDLPPSAAG